MNLSNLITRIYEEYGKRTSKSSEAFIKAKKVLPGGDTRSVAYFEPYPLYIRRAKGSRLHDIDGNIYIDFLNNHASLIHGHAYPRIINAVKKCLENGWIFAANTESQYKLGNIICERFGSIKKVRFCNSGTEATMLAIQAARAYTRKNKIMKMEGGYHGTHPTVQVSVTPDVRNIGPLDKPLSVPELGIPENVVKDVLVTQFNNKHVTEKIIEANKNDLAAVIVEPMMGAAGMIPPRNDYLKFLREITVENGILLIFDEVITARLSLGGMQEMLGIIPDLTALGKIIGGGFPVGACGGREDIMDLFSPERPEYISHSGTFNGNVVTMEAGIACLEALKSSAVEKVNSLGNYLKKGIEKVLDEEKIVSQVTGIGSLGSIHFTPVEITDYRTAETSNKDARKLIHLSLLNRGIFVSKRCMFDTSTVMTQDDINKFISSFRECAKVLRNIELMYLKGSFVLS